MNSRCILALAIIIFNSCAQHQNSNREAKDVVYKDSLSQLFKSNGIASFINTNENLKRNFKVMNEDGSEFINVLINKDSIVVKGKGFKLSEFETNRNLFQRQQFSPRGFWPEYGIFQFEVVSFNDTFIEVFIDKDKNIKKRIAFDSTLFKVESWEQHIIGTMIDFNQQRQFIHSYPSEKSPSMHYEQTDEELIFVVSKIQGDWLYIESENICGFEKNPKYDGWIKWRDKENILIKFSYAC